MMVPKIAKLLLFVALLLPGGAAYTQSTPDADQLGSWYMYFFNKNFDQNRFGFQGDFQYRSWNAGGDLEQLLLRGGLTYRPVTDGANVLLTLGYANVTTGAFGDSDATFAESRIYQEAFLPHALSKRILLTHRFRYEQRWVEDQDFRTRFRYNLFVNVLLNKDAMEKKTTYLALYNELFINGETNIGGGREVQLFDRNRLYLGLGYGLRDNLRAQLGWMRQTVTNLSKAQLQVSLHHSL